MKLLQIDGLNLVRRIYEANPQPPGPAKMENVTTSVMGSIRRALETHTPSHALMPFDFGGATWRHALYPAYREKRKPMPPELKEALPALRAQLEERYHLKTVAVPGVEADDVIAAVFRVWRKHFPAAESVILSTDKDLTALVAEGAQVYDHFERVWRNDTWIANKFEGITPQQVQDFLALQGDPTDGIPGAPGVGAKTAARWLREHQTLETLLTCDLKGAKGKALLENAELVQLSKKLVSFNTDFKVGLTFSQIQMAY